MTPEEKAKWLVGKFKDFAHTEWDEFNGYSMASNKSNAKKCALICCDKMIEQLVVLEKYWSNDVIDPLSFWHNTKEEINKL